MYFCNFYDYTQVERRALEVWGSEQNLEDEKEKRKLKQEMAKKKKYQKKFRELQKEVITVDFNFFLVLCGIHQYKNYRFFKQVFKFSFKHYLPFFNL